MPRRLPPAWVTRESAAKLGLTAVQRAVLLCLWDHAGAELQAYPGVPTIAQQTGFSDRSVKYALVELEARRFITRLSPVSAPGKWRRQAVEWSLAPTASHVIPLQALDREAV